MASVTFPPAIGGDGSTVTDDANATTGLGNGGHRLRFIPTFTQLVNVCNNVIGQLTTLLGSTTTQANNAATSASNAATSAATALSAPGTNATSTTSMLLGLGSKTITIQTGKSIVAGMAIMVADAAAPATNYAHGVVTSYTSGTGALVFTVDYIFGSGTLSNWIVSLTAPIDPSRAPLASPGFTGVPTAPTAAAGTNTTQLATTAFVKRNAPRGRILMAQGG
jgi:hypothetical protein